LYSQAVSTPEKHMEEFAYEPFAYGSSLSGEEFHKLFFRHAACLTVQHGL
jgi:hypothetical protein